MVGVFIPWSVQAVPLGGLGASMRVIAEYGPRTLSCGSLSRVGKFGPVLASSRFWFARYIKNSSSTSFWFRVPRHPRLRSWTRVLYFPLGHRHGSGTAPSGSRAGLQSSAQCPVCRSTVTGSLKTYLP